MEQRSTGIGVGAQAPDFVLAGLERLSSRELAGLPLVLAFSRGWSIEHHTKADLRAIRAQLRGLGAAMAVLSRTGVWYFRADDDLERFALPSATLDAEVPRVAHTFEVDWERGPALFLLDGRGIVRFARHAPHTTDEELSGAFVTALEAAGRAAVSGSGGPRALSRRDLVTTSLVAGLVLAFVDGCKSKAPAPVTTQSAEAPATTEQDLTLVVNGEHRTLRVEPRVTLLDALRERLDLTGTKKGCDMGQCGSCTVLVNGRRIKSCLTLAVMHQGAQITTIEGLAKGEVLHPLQAAFIAEDAFQCGFCTPGQIMSAVGLLSEGRATSDAEVREEMSGNLCRCGAYPNIVRAIQNARKW